MKQVLLPLAATAAIILILGVFHKYPDSTKSALNNPGSFVQQTVQKNVYNKKELKIGKKTLLVEIADTQESRTTGLSGRKSLAENEGMLFVFESQNIKQAFWMKDMKFSIDIIWIKDGKVAQITKEVPAPAPDTPDRNLSLYIPDAPIDYVLEVIGGFCDQQGIKVGDEVTI